MFLLVVMTVLFSWQSTCARKFTENYAGADQGWASSVYSIFYGLVIALLTLAINGFRFSASRATVLLGLLCGVALVIYTTCIVQASARGPHSFMTLSTMSGGLLVPLFYDMIFHGERLAAIQLFGVALLLLSAVVMNLQGLNFRGGKPKKGYFLCCGLLLLSNGAYCQLMSIQQRITGGPERAEMIIVTYAFTGLSVLCWRLLRDRKDIVPSFRMGRRAFLYALGACLICTSATNMLLYLLSTTGSAAVLYAVHSGGVMLLGGIYSIVLFHEKLSVSQLIGLGMAVVSVVILNVF